MLILEAYLLIEIQKIFWNFYVLQNDCEDETFGVNPNKYGTHNIAMCVVDMMPVNLDGSMVLLPSKFDDFTCKANIYYDGCSNIEKVNRYKFIEIAISNGLVVYDDSLLEYGMKYDYEDSKFKPVDEKNIYINKIKKSIQVDFLFCVKDG